MAYVEIPSDEQVVEALKGLKRKATAVELCEALVAAGHPRPDSQLAIQRAIERKRISVGSDWKLSIVELAVAA